MMECWPTLESLSLRLLTMSLRFGEEREKESSFGREDDSELVEQSVEDEAMLETVVLEFMDWIPFTLAFICRNFLRFVELIWNLTPPPTEEDDELPPDEWLPIFKVLPVFGSGSGRLATDKVELELNVDEKSEDDSYPLPESAEESRLERGETRKGGVRGEAVVMLMLIFCI